MTEENTLSSDENDATNRVGQSYWKLFLMVWSARNKFKIYYLIMQRKLLDYLKNNRESPNSFFTNMMLSAQFYTFFSKNTFCKNSEAQIVKKIKNNLGNQKLKNQKNKYWWQCDNFLKPKCFKHKYINSILQQNKFNTINIFGFDIVWCSIIEGNVVFSKSVVVIDAFTFKPTIFV